MMKEIKAKEVMKMFENQNVVNRTDFTFEEYLDQLISFQKIVSSCVYDGDDSYRLCDSITRIQQLIRSKGIKDTPLVQKAVNRLKEANKELAIIMAGKKGEKRIEKALEYVDRPDMTFFKNKYITDGEEETEIDTILVTNNGIIILEVKNAKQDITISQDGRLLYDNEISFHNVCIGEKMEKKRRLLKYQIEKEMENRGIDSIGKPIRIESRIVFSTPYQTRINVTDLYKKERFWFKSILTHKVNEYYSGTCYESEDLQMLNDIIGSIESNKKRFQQKLDFAKVNSDFANLMEMLTAPETDKPEKNVPVVEAKTSDNADDLTTETKRNAKHQIFGKIAIPVASAAMLLASIVSGIVITKRN